jgi:hypothetical protein
VCNQTGVGKCALPHYQGLISVPARGVAGIEITIFKCRTAFEDFRGNPRYDSALLDSEVVAGKIEMEIGRVPDRRHVARAMPRDLHAEKFSNDRDFAAGVGN